MRRLLNGLLALSLVVPFVVQMEKAGGMSVIRLEPSAVTPSGEVLENSAYGGAMTPDGRYVAYFGPSDGILLDRDFTQGQVYIYDRQAHTTELVSVASDGVSGEEVGGAQYAFSISNDGRYVLFSSPDTGLTGGTDTSKHLYLRDRILGVTMQIDTGGTLMQEYVDIRSLSGDGSIIVYLGTQESARVQFPNAISQPDMAEYVYNRTTGQTVSLPVGARDATVSSDGHHVLYNGLLDSPVSQDLPRAMFMYNVSTGATAQASDALSSVSRGGVLSPNNSYMAYLDGSGDNNHGYILTVFAKNLDTATTQEVPNTTYANPHMPLHPAGNLSFSADNNLLTFYKDGYSPSVADLANNTQLTLVPGARTYKMDAMQLSADGTSVMFGFQDPNHNYYQNTYVAQIGFADAPLNLTALSPTTTPELNWDMSVGASSYNIYRNGAKIGSATIASYQDATAPTGNNSYYVTAVDFYDGESGPSNTVDVEVNAVPTFTSTNSAAVNVRDLVNFTVSTNGYPVAAITVSGTLPNGVAFIDNGDGTGGFIGQPAPGSQGVHVVTLMATNAVGIATQQFTLTVNNAQVAPTFLSSDSVSVNQRVAFSFTVNTTGNSIPNITKVGGNGGLPKGVHFKDNNDGTATISGMVKDKDATGTSTFTLQAKNQSGTAQQQFMVTWEP